MRWHVEVTSMDSADTQSVVVEAESWQKALHAARVARGEGGPISGFSIELLDEGYRAVDPLARRRYDVKRATDGTPTTFPVLTVATPTSVTPAPVPAAAAPAPAAAAAAPPAVPAAPDVPRPGPPSRKPPPPSAAAKAPTASPPSKAPTSSPPPKGPAASPPSKAPAGSPPSKAPAAPPASKAPASKRPSSGKLRVVPPAAPPPNDQIIVPTAIMAVVPANGADMTIRTEAMHAPPSPPPPPSHVTPSHVAHTHVAPSSTELDGVPVPPTQVIFKREHDPSERLPLTYREYVFTVARGVNEESGERLLRVQLDQVRASIASARPGKFVNLAVFDVVFQGKPPVPPLATLAWKDWRGEPTVAFPRRAPTNHVAAARPAAEPAAQPSAPPQSSPAPTFPAPVAAPSPPLALQALPASHQPPPPAQNNPFASFAPPPAPFAPGGAPLPPGVPVPGVPVAASGAPAPPIAAPLPPAHPQPNAALIAAIAPSQVPPAEAAAPPPAPAAFPVPPAPPPAAFPVAPAPPPPGPPRGPNDSAIRGPRGAMPSRPIFRPASGRRATGDELIANLFEAMHELHFTRDVIEGGDYVLLLALEMIPSRAALLHLYDIDRREYVVACVSGTGTDALLNQRIAESDPLFASAMRKRRALVFADARSEESTASSERFVLLGGPVSVIVSPIMKGGRFLGVLELMNPLDGVAFTEEEGNAIDYLSEQLGEFVATRGTQLDPDRITRSVPPSGLAES